MTVLRTDNGPTKGVIPPVLFLLPSSQIVFEYLLPPAHMLQMWVLDLVALAVPSRLSYSRKKSSVMYKLWKRYLDPGRRLLPWWVDTATCANQFFFQMWWILMDSVIIVAKNQHLTQAYTAGKKAFSCWENTFRALRMPIWSSPECIYQTWKGTFARSVMWSSPVFFWKLLASYWYSIEGTSDCQSKLHLE